MLRNHFPFTKPKTSEVNMYGSNYHNQSNGGFSVIIFSFRIGKQIIVVLGKIKIQQIIITIIKIVKGGQISQVGIKEDILIIQNSHQFHLTKQIQIVRLYLFRINCKSTKIQWQYQKIFGTVKRQANKISSNNSITLNIKI